MTPTLRTSPSCNQLTSEWDPTWNVAGLDLHDEIDFELLGNDTSYGMNMQTNWYAAGVGNHEERYNFWFDPTADYHEHGFLVNYEHVM